MIDIIRAYDQNNKPVTVLTDDSIPLTNGMIYIYYSAWKEQWEVWVYKNHYSISTKNKRKGIIAFLP